MRKILTVSALAMLLAAPAFADPGDPSDAQNNAAWQRVVEKANDARLAGQKQQQAPAPAQFATGGSLSATTDAGLGRKTPPVSQNYLGPYKSALAITHDR